LPNEASETPVRPRGQLLVFVHIPKTAGSTLRTVLSMNEPGDRSRALGNVFKGGGGISNSLIDRLRKDQGPDLRGVGLVRGHFPLGIREYLPQYLPKDRELRCFTFLREPADRTLSHYFRIRESPAPYGLPPLPAEATVEDALERGYIHDNVQTRMLSGLAEPFGEVTDEMLEQAKHNLRELAFFGLTERFDESLVLAQRRLGFRTILYKSSGRVNTNRARGDELSAALVQAAKACNRYDTELYRYAEELFDAAPEREELDFEVELAALRAAKANGEPTVAPVPTRFAGDEQAWEMLLQARVNSQRLEWDLAGNGVKAAAARARTRALKQEVDRLEAVPARMKELEREVERLEAASSRIQELEREVERLKAAAEPGSRRGDGPSSPKRGRAGPKREARQAGARQDEPREAGAKQSGARQSGARQAGARQAGARQAAGTRQDGARPKREARQADAERSSEPRTRRPRSGRRAGSDRTSGGDGG
jgi:hypothetical protein